MTILSAKVRFDLTAPQAGRLLGVSANTIKAMVESGKLLGYRVGGDGRIRIPWGELDRVRNEWAVHPDVSEAL